MASNPGAVTALAQRIAPDVVSFIQEHVQTIAPEVFCRLAPAPPPTGIMALAKRPAVNPLILQHRDRRPLVLLDDPRHYGNIGAVIRVAAAAQAAAVVVLGDHDPWHPEAVRGAAGLQFALPVLRLGTLPATLVAPLVAVDPEGQPLSKVQLPPGAALVFGSERHGISEALLRRAAFSVRIPMVPKVSSLNLATSVAVMLYHPG